MHISPYTIIGAVMARRQNIHSFIAQTNFNLMDSPKKTFPSKQGPNVRRGPSSNLDNFHLLALHAYDLSYNSGTHPFRNIVDSSLKSRLNRLPDHGRSGPAILCPVRFALNSSQGWFMFDKRFAASHVPDGNFSHSVVLRATPKMGLVPNYISVTVVPGNALYFCSAALLY